jgi:hypothetical protein
MIQYRIRGGHAVEQKADDFSKDFLTEEGLS